jgi:hypothetical protein
MKENDSLEPELEPLKILVGKVEKQYEADVVVYFGDIVGKWADYLIDECQRNKCHPMFFCC